MIRLQRWFIRRIFRSQVRQGYDHDSRIEHLYALVREACMHEFPEDNAATMDAYLQERFAITQGTMRGQELSL